MISCQNQRVFLPTGLGMSAMAQVLWDRNVEFEAVAKEYFINCFGKNGMDVMEYLSALSTLFNPPYLREEYPVVDKYSAENYARIPVITKAFMQKIKEELESTHYKEIAGSLCSKREELVSRNDEEQYKFKCT